jgi:hypothetical protein
MTPAINYCRCRCYRRLIFACVVDTSDKLIANVMESMKISGQGLITGDGATPATDYNDTGDSLLTVSPIV